MCLYGCSYQKWSPWCAAFVITFGSYCERADYLGILVGLIYCRIIYANDRSGQPMSIVAVRKYVRV